MEYEEGLDRALETTPDVGEAVDRLSLPDPDVRQEGAATIYENFQATLEALGRAGEHVMKHLQSELGTSAHVDDRGRLRLTGAFRTERIREAMEAYVERYVRCPECGLPDTRIETERGAEILRCTACGARSPTGGE